MNNKNNVDYKELLIMKSRRPDFTMTIDKLILLNSLKKENLENKKNKKCQNIS